MARSPKKLDLFANLALVASTLADVRYQLQQGGRWRATVRKGRAPIVQVNGLPCTRCDL
jgi:hypothetical protein